MRNAITLLTLTAVLSAYPGAARGQDSTAASSRAPQLDSATFDTIISGPRYEFTGREDPSLLAAAFMHAARMGRQAARETPSAYCVALGRTEVPPPSAVLSLLANAEPPYRPRSVCVVNVRSRRAVTDTSSGKGAWILSVTALRTATQSQVTVYISYYVGPLWAEGWVCNADHASGGWSLHDCVRRWIS
jgi:hypothetical protein